MGPPRLSPGRRTPARHRDTPARRPAQRGRPRHAGPPVNQHTTPRHAGMAARSARLTADSRLKARDRLPPAAFVVYRNHNI